MLFARCSSAISSTLLVLAFATSAIAEENLVDMMRADSPVAWWRLDEAKTGDIVNAANPETLAGVRVGPVQQGFQGPTGKAYPTFPAGNRAAAWAGQGYFRVSDPGDESVLDFQQGDAITIEAWVNPTRLANDRQNYIVGKGRTFRNGKRLENQNWALRLRGIEGTARLSFLFPQRCRRQKFVSPLEQPERPGDGRTLASCGSFVSVWRSSIPFAA